MRKNVKLQSNGTRGTDSTYGRRDVFDIRSGRELLVALLLVGGTITVLHVAPYLLAAAIPAARMWKDSPENKRVFSNTFSRLKRVKYLTIKQSTNGSHDVSLTKRGIKVARRGYSGLSPLLNISPPRKWDRKWRLILFDVSSTDQSKRTAFRSLIRRLGAVMLQKSVWIYPYDCTEQINILKSFFTFTDKEVRVVVADTIGNDRELRTQFRVY